MLPALLLLITLVSTQGVRCSSALPASTTLQHHPQSHPPSSPPQHHKHKHAAGSFNNSGINMTAALSPYAAKWRLLPAEMYQEFGEAYEKLGPGFFKFYNQQMPHNGRIVKHVIGVAGKVTELTEKLWHINTELWVGLRGVLTGIEQLLETFLHYLANSLQSVLDKKLLAKPEMVQDLKRVHAAVQSAHDGYEKNYELCHTKYMSSLRKQFNGMQALHKKAQAAVTKKEKRHAQTKFETFYDTSNAKLVKIMKRYWNQSLKVYYANWKLYSDAFLAVLKQM